MRSILARTAMFVALLGIFVSGCSDDDKVTASGSSNTAYDFSATLSSFSTDVVIQTYADLDSRAGELLNAVNALQGDATAANLYAARDRWVATRVPWESSEAFIFGPVDFSGYDPALDSWPVNRTDLDGVLSSSNDLTETYIGTLDGTLRGFHTIEYLLFDAGGSKTAEEFTSRQLEYLVACVKDLKSSTNALHKSWVSSGGNYGSKLADAGSGSDVYPSQQAAVQEIINGMIGICDEVANGKIADPYVEKDARLVESQFSFNSLTDFQNNIRSVANAYTGGDTGTGLDEFVTSRNAVLDARLKLEIQTAIDEIGRISYPFRDAINTDGSQIERAQQAIATIQQTLENDILPLVLN